jgi:lipopolysaccharide transport system ATP-binding protein
MSSEPRPEPAVVGRAVGLGKCYHVYAEPRDRLRQLFARGGRKHYREFWALRGVDLELRRGETLGIVGRNGAGKSTLLQMVAGTLKPTEGRVAVEGRVTALLELGSGFHPEFSGRDNVFLSGSILGLDRAAMDARIERIAEFANIGEFLDRPVKTYSKGMFARLAFAVYANLDPDVFIVDEALAVGDARFRHRCMHRFRQMQEQGVSIVYVSHDAPSMKQLCDRVAWIDGGRLRAVGEPREVVDAYLTDLFHGESQRLPARREAVDAADGPALAGPPGDERAGAGRCRFVEVRLAHPDGSPAAHLELPAACTLEVALRNLDLDPERDRIQTGFWLRNARGVAITGTNTGVLGLPVPLPARGATTRLRYRIQLPRLQPGSYSCTVMVSTLGPDGQPELQDRIVNALVFRASVDREVHGMFGCDCRAEVVE